MVEIGHGGTLTLESKGLSKGATARIEVPVEWLDTKEPTENDEDELSWVKYDATAYKDILLVDDFHLIRQVLVNVCEKAGLSYDEASDGVEANKKMESNLYSVVIMDNQMSKRSGLKAIKIARENGYRGAIALASADTFEISEEEDLKRNGVTAVITKMNTPGVPEIVDRLKDLKKKS